MGVSFRHKGNFNNIERFVKKYDVNRIIKLLDSYGREGVRALSSATPEDSGLTASSWRYETDVSRGSFSIAWYNDNTTSTGTPVAILLQYGHGTGTGGYVQGRDYINPAIEPIFNRIADAVWQEVKAI